MTVRGEEEGGGVWRGGCSPEDDGAGGAGQARRGECNLLEDGGLVRVWGGEEARLREG